MWGQGDGGDGQTLPLDTLWSVKDASLPIPGQPDFCVSSTAGH